MIPNILYIAKQYKEHSQNNSLPKTMTHKDVLVRSLLDESKRFSFFKEEIDDWADQTIKCYYKEERNSK